MLRKNDKAKRRGLFFAAGAVALMISAIAFTGCNDSEGEKKAASSAKPGGAPTVVSDVSQSLEQFKGKVVLLDLWATWCPPCKAEIPSFVRLQQKYRDQGFEIVGVSLDPVDPRGGGGAAAVGPVMQQMGINYTVWLGHSREALGKFPLGQGYPTTYIINRDGRPVKQYVGLTPEATFENDIKSLL